MPADFMTLQWFADHGWLAAGGRLLVAVVVVLAAFMAARLAKAAIARMNRRRRFSLPAIYIFERLVSYGLIGAGVFVGLSTVGVNLTSLAVFAGAIGVGVGLGLQGIVREFVSGMVAIFDSNIHVGDFVELDDGLRGEIVEIGPRASRIRTNDAMDVVLPNSKLIENRVTNWTLHGETRRFRIPFTVAHGVDKAKVREAVLRAARGAPHPA